MLLISLSAFFADLGYQTALAIFPIFLVITLKAPAYEFGLANAIAFGIGSMFGYAGGLLNDRFDGKWVAVAGNAFIPLISLVGLASSPVTAIALFSGGWWARNFRSPPRRAMLASSSSEADRSRVFGFLHALDIGGGMVSIMILVLLLLYGLGFKDILLLTALPLAISTLLLLFSSSNSKANGRRQSTQSLQKAQPAKIKSSTYKGIIIATLLYGFSSYSLGFPIITIAQTSSSLLGIASYGIYLGVSAFAGYYIGAKKLNRIRALGLAGYLLSGLATLMLGIAYILHAGVAVFYISVAILGFSLGAIETIEPTIISLIKGARNIGRGMGSLSASRSIGIFFANIIMGLLYVLNPSYSYIYSGIISIAAAAIVLYMGRGFRSSA